MRAILERYSLLRQQTDENGNYVFDDEGNAVYEELTQDEKRLAAEEFLAHLQETNGVPVSEIYQDNMAEIHDFAREHGMDPRDLSQENIDKMTREWMSETNYRPPRPSWFKQFISRIRTWLRMHGFGVHHLSDDELLTILARAAKAEVSRRGGSKAGEGTRYAVNNGTGARPYYDVPFAESVDAVINGTAHGGGLVFVTKTPDVFKAIGIPGFPIMITRQHIKDIYNLTASDGRNAHDLGEQLKHLPDMLDKPVAIIAEPDEKEGRSENRVVAITQYRDKHGNDIMIPVIIGATTSADGTMRITANIAATTYGKQSAPQMLQNAIDAEKRGEVAIFGANKKITSKLPMPGTPIVPGGGFNAIHNINDSNSPVKGTFAKKQTESLQFDRYFKGSKVVDQNGDPLVVYHGTRGTFYVFDGSKSGSNLDFGTMGKGFYFTTDRQNAENIAKNNNTGNGDPVVMECFLSIKNPKEISWNEISGNNKEEAEQLTEKWKSKGYDGFVAQAPNGATWWVAFEPEQIKSATDNIGTFDANNPDIRYSVREFDPTAGNERAKNVVAMLRPLVGRKRSGFDNAKLAAEIKQRHGVDVTPAEVAVWLNEAIRQNAGEMARNTARIRNEWLYNNNALWKQAVDYAGSENFKVRVSDRMKDRNLEGTFWLKKGDEKNANTVIDLDALANEVA